MNLLKNNKEVKNQSLILATEAYFTDGYFDNPQNFNRFNGMLKYHGKLNDNNFLTAFFSGLSSKWNASGQIPDRAIEDGTIGWFWAIDANEGGKTSRYNFNANLKSYLKMVGNSLIKFSILNINLSSIQFYIFLNDPINGDQIRQKRR